MGALKQNTDNTLEQRKEKARQWFDDLQGQICDAFERIEDHYLNSPNPKSFDRVSDSAAVTFEKTPWTRTPSNNPNESGSILNGGGEMRVMRGRVFEKVGVNVSCVYGRFSEKFAKEIPGAEESGGAFWAAGISLVAHMRSPLVPAVHMNTRMIATSKCWFGGGADLTPTFEFDEDTEEFHKGLKDCCDRHGDHYYAKFKPWCDDYFFLPHRNEPRGIGGIFYDYLEGDWDRDFDFTQDVGTTFLDTYNQIVRRRMLDPWTKDQKEQQLIKRGRYVEFNLLHDRGTRFGLMTGGNTEAILMSMPPEAKWP
jgi:coproporphyrinogen III oxidase